MLPSAALNIDMLMVKLQRQVSKRDCKTQHRVSSYVMISGVVDRSWAICGIAGMNVPLTNTRIMTVSDWFTTQRKIESVRGSRPLQETKVKMPRFLHGEKRS